MEILHDTAAMRKRLFSGDRETTPAQAVETTLRATRLPNGRDAVSLGWNYQLHRGKPSILAIEVPQALGESLDSWREDLATSLATSFPDGIRVVLTAEQKPQAGLPPAPSASSAPTPRNQPANREAIPLDGIRNLIAIASGKGGVGKSTVTANLAFALARDGFKVGLLDADIYGPSQALMLGVTERAEAQDGKILPHEVGGIKIASMGTLLSEDKAAIWRGPMVQQALVQLLRDVAWGELDYLLLDFPPGTGDIPLTLAQRVPQATAVLVSTPQEVALLDVRKAATMFRRLSVPLLGIVENMSGLHCTHCGEINQPFGQGGAKSWADQEGIAFLGSLPLDKTLRESGDAGAPLLMAEPDSPVAGLFREIAHNLVKATEKKA